MLLSPCRSIVFSFRCSKQAEKIQRFRQCAPVFPLFWGIDLEVVVEISACLNGATRGWKIWAVGKKEQQHTWLKNFGAVEKKNNCRTREWKILVRSEKKELQHTWLENFGVVGKKGTAEHVTEKFMPSEKNNCGTGEWKILVRSEKKELQHTWLENFGAVGKKLQNTWMENFGAVEKKELQHTWLENLCRRKKRTAEHVA